VGSTRTSTVSNPDRRVRGGTIRKSDFVDECAERTGTTKAAAAATGSLDAALEIISDTLQYLERSRRPTGLKRGPQPSHRRNLDRCLEAGPRFKPGKALRDAI
jgi:hypothetical protein